MSTVFQGFHKNHGNVHFHINDSSMEKEYRKDFDDMWMSKESKTLGPKKFKLFALISRLKRRTYSDLKQLANTLCDAYALYKRCKRYF